MRADPGGSAVGDAVVQQKVIIGGSSHKYHFCRDKHTKHVFVVTKHDFCRDKSMLLATKVLPRHK